MRFTCLVKLFELLVHAKDKTALPKFQNKIDNNKILDFVFF